MLPPPQRFTVLAVIHLVFLYIVWLYRFGNGFLYVEHRNMHIHKRKHDAFISYLPPTLFLFEDGELRFLSPCGCELVGGECVPKLAWDARLPPCCFVPGETCMAASWAAYNCCEVRERGTRGREDGWELGGLGVGLKEWTGRKSEGEGEERKGWHE